MTQSANGSGSQSGMLGIRFMIAERPIGNQTRPPKHNCSKQLARDLDIREPSKSLAVVATVTVVAPF